MRVRAEANTCPSSGFPNRESVGCKRIKYRLISPNGIDPVLIMNSADVADP